MAKKNKAPEPAVRKSFLVMGGAAIGAAVFGFILLNFVLGGGGDGADQATELATLNNATIPIASATPAPGSDGAISNVLTPGGRDPFSKPEGVSTGASANPGGLNPTSSSSGSTALAAPAEGPAPTTTYVAPAPQPIPVGEGPAPAPDPAPAPTGEGPAPAPSAEPRPPYQEATITVLAVYTGAADVRIDDTVFEGARTDDVLTERFKMGEFEGSCFYVKDRYPKDSENAERFKLCADDTVTR